MSSLSHEYSLPQAVRDGVLLDFTPLAHEAKLPYPTFVSSAFWNCAEIGRSETRLRALLEDAWILRRCAEERRYGTHLYALEPDLKKRGWPKAAFPRLALFNLSVLSSEACGVLLVLTGGYETLDLRVPRTGSGSFYTM